MFKSFSKALIQNTSYYIRSQSIPHLQIRVTFKTDITNLMQDHAETRHEHYVRFKILTSKITIYALCTLLLGKASMLTILSVQVSPLKHCNKNLEYAGWNLSLLSKVVENDNQVINQPLYKLLDTVVPWFPAFVCLGANVTTSFQLIYRGVLLLEEIVQ